MILFDLDLYLT